VFIYPYTIDLTVWVKILCWAAPLKLEIENNMKKIAKCKYRVV